MKTLGALLAVVTVSLSVYAQTPMSETIEVHVTNVDVVVTDRSGKPVTGLTKEDFEILEGGKPQPITNLYEIRASEMAAQDPSAPQPEPVPLEVSRRRIIVFVDNFTIHPLARNHALAALEKSLDSLMRPGDEAMLVFWNQRQELATEFTPDRARLLESLREATRRTSGGMTLEGSRQEIIEHASQMFQDAKTPGGAHKISIPQAYEVSTQRASRFAEMQYASQQALLGGLTRTIKSLAGIEGKKALIFLGAELTDNPGMELFLQIDGMFRFDIPDMKPAILREQGRNLAGELRKLAETANASGVTMYLVDTANRIRGGDPSQHMAEGEAAFAADTNTAMAMGMIASVTGGLAVSGGKSFEAALGTIARDLSSYYSLGYRSPEGDGNRKVTVRVKRDGLRVRSRSTYVARQGDQSLEDRVVANTFHPSVKSDFPVSLVAEPPQPAEDGRYKVKLTVTLPANLTLIPQDDNLKGEFAVYFATGTQDGGTSDVTKSVQPLTFPGNSLDAVHALKTFTYTATLLVPAGEQFVSVAVADTLAGTAGFARTKIVAQ